MIRCSILIAVCVFSSGCMLIPEVNHEPRYHNPFPQLHRVAVVPFFNQSDQPTVDGFTVANLYRNELQKIPGFEVMPIGVVEQLLLMNKVKLDPATDFQQLASWLGVDAVVVGSITDFSEYYPPRMGLAVNWYAANPCFHPIPPGYGLPWGRSEEEFIPDSLRLEAEFAHQREQLSMQTPVPPQAALETADGTTTAPHADVAPAQQISAVSCDPQTTCGPQNRQGPYSVKPSGVKPSGVKPNGVYDDGSPVIDKPCLPYRGPVIRLVQQYNGDESGFTRRLSSYYSLRNDARFGGWQSYLQRKDDFIRFCCYLHITEMLAARGGAGETRVVWRWLNDRYEH